MSWSTTVPGTSLNRVELLSKLLFISKEASGYTVPLRNERIREVMALGVLNIRQTAALFGVNYFTVKNAVSNTPFKGSGRKGYFNPDCLELLLDCAKVYSMKDVPAQSTVEMVTRVCAGKLAERLCGLPFSTYVSAQRRAETAFDKESEKL